MSDAPSEAAIAGAEAYEALFVAGLFQEWAPRVADAGGVRSGQRILDVACGTGVLAREATDRVGTSGSVVGLDADAGMLAVAERLAPTGEWHQGTAEALPFADASFDVVMSQFGLMFFSDRSQALREMCRVLKPGGTLAVAVWDTLANNPAYAADVELLDRTAGRSAGDALRAPFVLGDRTELAALFADAGLASATIETTVGKGRFPSIRTMVEADLRGWLPLMGVALSEAQIEHILSEAEVALGPYRRADGTVEFESAAHVVSVEPAPVVSGSA